MAGFQDSLLNIMLDAIDDAGGAVYLGLHTSDTSGSELTSTGGYVRKALTYAAASGADKLANGTFPTWTATADWAEFTHWAFWSASTAGTFHGAFALPSPRTIQNGDTYNISTLTVTAVTAP